jgi:ATP-dependent Lon protease
LNARDAKAVRKTVAGLLKLLHPDREFTRDELKEYLELALEARRRVKEQLKKMGAFEYFQVSFSYLDNDTREEHFVGVPEEGGRDLVAPDPLPAGCVYGAAVSAEDKVALHRVEVSRIPGGGKLKIAGSPDKGLRDSITTAYDYLRARKRELGLEAELDAYDWHVQVVDLLAARDGSAAGTAFFVAVYSLLKGKPVLPGLVVMGQVTIKGSVLPVRALSEALQTVMDNGARRVLLPTENKRQWADLPGEVVERVDTIFYSDPLAAAIKALGLT